MSTNESNSLAQDIPKPPKGAGKTSGAAPFKFYIHDGRNGCRLQLIGHLRETQVEDLNGCWRTAKSTLGTRGVVLDLLALESVDEAGKQWLASMAEENAACLPEHYLREIVAGKHCERSSGSIPARKAGILGRLLGFFRGAPVQAE